MRKKTTVLTLGLVLVLSACANESPNTVSTTEASIEVSIDNEDPVSNTIEASADTASKSDVAASTESKSDSDSASASTDISSDINEVSTKDNSNSEIAAEDTSNIASNAVSNITTVSSDASADKPAVAGASKSSEKKSSLMSKFPVIDYPANGTGRGPGANFRKGHDYENHEVAGGKVLGELNWWELTTWTASNGVVLKVLPADQGFPNGAPIIDGCGLDNVPGSDFLLAVAECLGTGDYWGEGGTDMSYQMTVVPVSQIPAASAKRTSIDVNDATLLGYKASYEELMNNDGGLNAELLIDSGSVRHRAADGGDAWVIYYNSGMGAWEVRINVSSPYQRVWDGIKNILKYVNPDGEALYNLIYEDFYTGRLDVIPNFDEWYPYGSNYIYVPDNTNMGYAMYYIK